MAIYAIKELYCDLVIFFYNREISFEEAQYLTAVLASNENPLILGALAVIANLAVFSSNQDKLRDAGLVAILPKLIFHTTRQIKQRACTVAANMAINEKNNAGKFYCLRYRIGPCLTLPITDFRSVTISLVHLIQSTTLSDPALITSALTALVNVAVLPSWHKEMKILLHKTYGLLDEGHWNSDGVSFQSLRLLINLSCNEEMVPSLLASQVAKLMNAIV